MVVFIGLNVPCNYTAGDAIYPYDAPKSSKIGLINADPQAPNKVLPIVARESFHAK